MRRCLIFLCIFILVGTENIFASTYTDELSDIVSVVLENELSIDSWEVTLKEKMTSPNIKKVLKQLQSDPTMDVSVQEHKDVVQYIGKAIYDPEGVTVIFKAIFPSSEEDLGQLIVAITGKYWDENISVQYNEIIQNLTHKYFSESVHKFTCLEAYNNDIIEGTTLLKRIKQSLQLKHTFTQTDDVQMDKQIVEIYGFNALWGESFTIEDKPMNAHISYIHARNGEEKIIIGTPILLNEY